MKKKNIKIKKEKTIEFYKIYQKVFVYWGTPNYAIFSQTFNFKESIFEE